MSLTSIIQKIGKTYLKEKETGDFINTPAGKLVNWSELK